jgi:hypothetical protein
MQSKRGKKETEQEGKQGERKEMREEEAGDK